MRVLFICHGNVARSQEAAAFLEKLSAGLHSATSAGIVAKVGESLDPMVVTVMSEIGYSMDSCQRKILTESMAKNADVLVSFKHAEDLPAFASESGRIQYWQVEDPRGQSLEFHRKTRDIIRELVEDLLPTLDSP